MTKTELEQKIKGFLSKNGALNVNLPFIREDYIFVVEFDLQKEQSDIENIFENENWGNWVYFVVSEPGKIPENISHRFRVDFVNGDECPDLKKIAEEKKLRALLKDFVLKLGRIAQQEVEYLNGWQRAKADFVNFKKDEAKRFEEFVRCANEELLREFIRVLDNFDLAIAALEKQGPIEKGVYLIRTQLEDALKKHGLERIPIALGAPFDPAVAEAIAEGESDKHPPGSVIEEIEPGYRLYDKIVRPARVKVARQRIEDRG